MECWWACVGRWVGLCVYDKPEYGVEHTHTHITHTHTGRTPGRQPATFRRTTMRDSWRQRWTSRRPNCACGHDHIRRHPTNYNFICGAQTIDLIQNIPFSINQYILEQNRTEIATKYTKIKRDSVYSII